MDVKLDKQAILSFFDALAPKWDEQLVIYEDKMKAILDAASIDEGSRVLDVACGTGVMIPYYLGRGAQSVTGIDLSPNMASICAGKFAEDARVSILCGDAETYDFGQVFDAVMVFNAFPHFADPGKVIGNLSRCVKAGGTITVAHDMGRKQLDSHHSGAASSVSRGMMHEDDVAALFDPSFDVVVKVSTPDIFIVSATRMR